MRSPLKISGFVLASLSIFSTQVLAYLPEITFEQPVYQPSHIIGQTSPDGWESIDGTASITAAGQGFGGTGQALKIAADPTEGTWLRKPITWNSSESIAFIDFRIKPAADPEGSLANFFSNGTQIAFQIPEHATAGELWVLDGNDPSTLNPPPLQEQWFKTPGSYNVPTGQHQSADWLRITLRHDYGRDLWDLFIDGKLAAVNLGFDGRNGMLQSLDFFGSTAGDTLVDNLSANPANMLFADSDKDGLPNDWELANGSNPNLYDRDQIKPGTGKSFLDLYLESLWTAPETTGKAVSGSLLQNGSGTGSLGSIPPQTLTASHQHVGALKGSLTVGGDGSASYSIPVDVPKGTAGMEPKISLNYSSNGGNGIAGLGWSLSGLQQIVRGGSTYYKDSQQVDGVDFDALDRFYLDGERLICVDGSYGAPGSVYRTEMDSFARITALGSETTSSGSGHVPGPASWKIETKSGLTVFLGSGSGTNSKVSTTRGALSWSVDKVQDSVGNYYLVNYARDTPGMTGEVRNQRVSEIKYTGTAAGAPYASVVFDYETRPDKRVFYNVGVRNYFDKRLAAIRVLTGSFENHRYELDYLTSHQTGRSLLSSVQKWVGSLSIPATTFDWQTLDHGDDRWVEVERLEIEQYANNDWDSRDGLAGMMSPVDNDPAHIHLTGVVWRAIPFDFTVTSNTWLEFECKASSVPPSFAMIGLDEDLATGTPARLVKVVGSGTPPGGGVMATSLFVPNSGDTPDGYDKKKIKLGTYFTGNTNYLVLVNDDVALADGQGETWFRNIRVYNETSPGVIDPASLKEMAFDVENVVPQMVNNQGSDLGLRLHDFTGDGRSDLMYRIFRDKVGGTGSTINLVNYGQTLKNTLLGYETVPITSSQNLVTGIRGSSTDAPWAGRVDLPSVPVDIDGDGKMDFCYAKNIHKPGTYSTAHWHGFMTWDPATDAWVDKPAHALPFKSVNNINYHRFNHFQFTDLNGDGFQDLVVNLNTGQLQDASGAVLSDADSSPSSAWINRVASGLPWLRNDALKIPKPLKVTGVANGEIGRRIFDANADGLPDFVQSRSVEAKEVWLNTGSTFVKQAAGSKYNLPIYLTNGNGDDVGARLIDLNGDGLTDAIKDMAYNGVSYATEAYLNTGDGWQQVADGAGGIANDAWTLPHLNFTHFDKYEESHPGHSSMADVNADGLLDLVVARWDEHKRIYFNTGTDWWASDSGQYWADNGSVTAADYHMPAPIYRTATAASVGKAVATFADVDGDGVVDYISDMDQPQPRVWINQCGPELIESVTDGFGATLGIEYTNLNDPTPLSPANKPAYTPAAAGSLLPGQVAAIHGGKVVTRLRESDGLGGFKATRRYYGDLRFDRHNEASLGFGWVEVHDEHFQANGGYVNRGYSVTRTMREYPFAGSPTEVETYVHVTDTVPGQSYVTEGTKLVSRETSTYALLPGVSGGGGTVKRPVQTSSEVTKYDLGGAVLSRVTTSQPAANFDVHGFLKESTITALDGSTTVTRNVYSHVMDSTRWWLGRLLASQVTKTAGGNSSVKTTGFAYSTSTGLLTKEVVEPASTPAWGSEPVLGSYNPVSAPPSGSFPGGVETVHSHDNFGNVTTTAVTAWVNGAGGTSNQLDTQQTRSTTTAFDSIGRFPISETTALGTVHFGYDSARALLTSSTDVDGRVTTFAYDSFGTKTATYLPGGTWTAEITREYVPSDLPQKVRDQLAASTGLPAPALKWLRRGQSAGAPASTAYFDVLGREVVKETLAYLGSSTGFASQFVVTRYDERGRKCMVSNPFLVSDSAIHWTTITYDLLDRPLVTNYPDGTSDGLDYPGTGDAIQVQGSASDPRVYTRIKNKRGYKLERWNDQHGRLVQSKDESGQTTYFAYDTENRATTVTIGSAQQLTNTYNIYGQKVSVWDLSAGTSSSIYNGFGEVEFVTNARGETTETRHDAMGRVTYVSGPEGTYQTSYRTASPAKGAPDTVTGPGGYEEKFEYGSASHDYGLPVWTSKRQSSAQATFYATTTYNALGLVMSETDAGGVQVVHDYDSQYGSVERMTRLAGPRTAKLSELYSVDTTADRIKTTEHLPHDIIRTVETDSRNGRIKRIYTVRGTTVLQDQSYDWDPNGNLDLRTNAKIGKSESFGYDSLDRLTSSTISGQPAVNYGYSPNGNLVTKGSDTLSYTNYRVTGATIKGGSRSYSYDNAGHVLSDGKRTYQWTSFGQLKEVYQASTPQLETFAATGTFGTEIVGIAPWVQYLQSQAKATFEFDAGGSRSRQTMLRTFADTSEASVITRYLGSYELEEHATKTAGGTVVPVKTLHRHSLGSALLTEECPGTTPRGTTASKVRLGVVLTDHIGSTELIVRAEWDHSNATWQVASGEMEAERQSFNAWGERRNAATWAALKTAHNGTHHSSGADYDRGFTGHEMLDDFGIIHMNGRIYDPELGRFLSADPYVQVPEYSQNFNRYSYVLNNPLSYTDSSGFEIDQTVAAILTVIVAIVAYYAAPAILGAMFGSTSAVAATGSAATWVAHAAQGFVTGFITGGAGSAISGGSAQDIVRGALVGAASGALAGGALHGIEKGNILRDSLGAVDSTSRTAAHIAGHGLLGGGTNAALGGKFQDGFLSGLFGAASTHFPGLDGFMAGAGDGDPAGILARTAVSGIAGGTGAAIGGGKFANGALTAAFQHLTNSEAGGWLRKIDTWTRPLGDFLHNSFGAQGSGSYVDGVARSSAAMLDGIIPFSDPLESAGEYSISEPGMKLSHGAGEAARDLALIAAGAGVGSRAAGMKQSGKEFSHWIPDRILKRSGNKWIRNVFGKSKINGNYVPAARHYKHDPFRYPRGWRDLGPRFPRWLRQLDRVPNLLKGAAGGAAVSAGARYSD